MEGRLAHGQMNRQLIYHHYLMLGLNLVVSTIIMYFVMFTMNWSFGDFFNNVNMLYMALMMATPMSELMLLMMRPMYPQLSAKLAAPRAFCTSVHYRTPRRASARPHR